MRTGLEGDGSEPMLGTCADSNLSPAHLLTHCNRKPAGQGEMGLAESLLWVDWGSEAIA